MGEQNTEMRALGARVRELRLRALGGEEMPQTDLAQRSGVAQQVISKIERGTLQRVGPGQLKALASALGEDPYYLFTGERPHALGPVAGRVHEIERRTPLDFYAADNIVSLAEREERRILEQAAADTRERELRDAIARLRADVEREPEMGRPALLQRLDAAVGRSAETRPRRGGVARQDNPHRREGRERSS